MSLVTICLIILAALVAFVMVQVGRSVNGENRQSRQSGRAVARESVGEPTATAKDSETLVVHHDDGAPERVG